MNHCMNDLGRFRIFVSVSSNMETRYSHRHSDALSYVIFVDGEALLIDPGRPFYSESDWVSSAVHNGLSPAKGLIPSYKFWKGKDQRRNFDLFCETRRECCVFKVKDGESKVTKILSFRHEVGFDGTETLKVDENLRSHRSFDGTFSLLHFNRADVSISLELEGTDVPFKQSLQERQYAHEYGVLQTALGFRIDFQKKKSIDSCLSIELRNQ